MRTLPSNLERIRDDLNDRFARWDHSMQRRKDQAGSAVTLVLSLLLVAASIAPFGELASTW